MADEIDKSKEISLAGLCMKYFSDVRKLTTTEYKELSRKDREELRELFIKDGFNVAPLPEPKS